MSRRKNSRARRQLSRFHRLKQFGSVSWLLGVLAALILFIGSGSGQQAVSVALDTLDLDPEVVQRIDRVLVATRELQEHWGLPWETPAHAAVRAPEAAGLPQTFDQAKRMLVREVYHDVRVESYCGCRFDSRLNVVMRDCPMKTAAFETRQRRIEWEHVVPASDFGQQRPCWRNPPPGQSGRAHCAATDETFRLMEADPHNLIPVVGALNAIRSNHRFGMVSAGTADPVVSGCGFKVSRAAAGRFIEPPDAVKGQVARTYFYMADRYGLRISRAQQQLFAAWDRQFPVTGYERERNRRLQAVTGVTNRFVEG